MKVIKLSDRSEIKVGETITDFHGELWLFYGIIEGHKIHVKPVGGGMDRIFYPSVFNLEVVE